MKGKSSRGGSFLGLLFVVFLVLKLTGVIDWSWWWVTSPLWLPAVLIVAGLLFVTVIGLVIYTVVSSVRKKRSAQGGRGQTGGTRSGGAQAGAAQTGSAQTAVSAEAVVVKAPGREVPRPEALSLPAPSPEADRPSS